MMRSKLYYSTSVIILITLAGLLTYRGGDVIHALYRRVLPDTSVLKNQYPVAIGKEGPHIIYKFQKQRPAHWLALSQISKQAVAAILMSEDSGFFQHHG